MPAQPAVRKARIGVSSNEGRGTVCTGGDGEAAAAGVPALAEPPAASAAAGEAEQPAADAPHEAAEHAGAEPPPHTGIDIQVLCFSRI